LPSLVAQPALWTTDDPVELAVWWEAVVATGQVDRLADQLGDYLTARLLVDNEPARWWPAVLAALTDWVIP
jgi:hypothetical protein